MGCIFWSKISYNVEEVAAFNKIRYKNNDKLPIIIICIIR